MRPTPTITATESAQDVTDVAAGRHDPNAPSVKRTVLPGLIYLRTCEEDEAGEVLVMDGHCRVYRSDPADIPVLVRT